MVQSDTIHNNEEVSVVLTEVEEKSLSLGIQ